MEINGLKGKVSYSVIIVGITVVGTLVVGLLIINPLFRATSKLTSEKNAMAATLKEKKDKLAVLNNLKDQQDSLTKDSETVANALPTQEEVGRLFIQLDSIAKTSGGNLRSVSQVAAASTTTGIIKEQEYTIPLDMPTYFALKQFITNAQSALSLLSISNIKVDSNDAGALTVNISAKSYSRSK